MSHKQLKLFLDVGDRAIIITSVSSYRGKFATIIKKGRDDRDDWDFYLLIDGKGGVPRGFLEEEIGQI